MRHHFALGLFAVGFAATARSQVDEVWVSRFQGPGAGDDGGLAVATDASGNVYVTGQVGSEDASDFATVKYDAGGAELWARTIDGPVQGEDVAVAIAVDAAGNAHVTGYSTGEGGDTDYLTAKYDAAGTLLWTARYNSPIDQNDEPAAVTLDDAGNVYITGRSSNSGIWFDYDYATVKYSPTGAQLWAARYNGAGDDWDEARAIAVDDEGNVFVSGTAAFDVGTAYHDYATVKYNASGVRQWVAFYDGAGNNWDEVQSLALDGEGNVIVTGYSIGSATGYDFATVKYTTDGAEVWARRHDGPGSGISHDIGVALVVDEAGNVYVGGTSALNYATVKYTASGDPAWESRFGAGGDDLITGVAIDETGVYVTGKSVNDYVTLKYDFAGTELWRASYDGPGPGADGAAALALDAFGNVVVTGASGGIGTGADFATIKYSQSTVAVEPGGASSMPLFVLEPSRPNPSRGVTTFTFSVPEGANAPAVLRVFDAQGRELERFIEAGSGRRSIAWDTSRLPSGTYFYSLEAGSFSSTRSMVHVR